MPPGPRPIDPCTSVHDAELATVLRLVEIDALPRTVVVLGELGTGRSTLLSRVSRELTSAGRSVRFILTADDSVSPPLDDEVWIIDDLDRWSPEERVAVTDNAARSRRRGTIVRIVCSAEVWEWSLAHDASWTGATVVEIGDLPEATALEYLDARGFAAVSSAARGVVHEAAGNLAILERVAGEGARLPAPPGHVVSRLPAQYSYLGAAFLGLDAQMKAALLDVAVRGLRRVDIGALDAAAQRALSVHGRERHAFVRAVDATAVSFSSALHRVAVLVHSSEAQRAAAHASAAVDPTLDEPSRAFHRAAFDPAAVDVLDAAAASAATTDALALLRMADPRDRDRNRRADRLSRIIDLATALGDLSTAAGALQDLRALRPSAVVTPVILELLGISEIGTASFDSADAYLDALESSAAAVDDPRTIPPDGVVMTLRGLRRAWRSIADSEWLAAQEDLEQVRIRARRGGAGLIEDVADALLAHVAVLRGHAVPHKWPTVSVVDGSGLAMILAAVWRATALRASGMADLGDVVSSAVTPESAWWTPRPCSSVMDEADAVRAADPTAPMAACHVSGRHVCGLAAAYAAAIARGVPGPAELAKMLLEHPDAHPYEIATVRMKHAEALTRVHDHQAARSQWKSAALTFEHIGADGLAAICRTKRDGVPRASGSEAGIADRLPQSPLTFQEERVVRLAATGLSNKEISRRLFLSPRTVGGHLYNAYPKLGVASRAALRDALLRRDEHGASRVESVS